jgi:tetratricopeptide (TPR) repeat protein
MFSGVRFSPLATLAILFCTIPCFAQHCEPYWTPAYKCAEGCGPCGGTSGGGGRSRTYTPPPPPSPAEIAARQATVQNDQGLAAFKRGDWAAADSFFKKSLEYGPNDPVFLRNLAITEDHEAGDAYKKGDYGTALNFLQQAVANDPASDTKNSVIIHEDLDLIQGRIAEAQREQEQSQRDKASAATMQQSIQKLAHSLSVAPSSSELDFNGSNPDNNSHKSRGLEFMGAAPATADKSTRARAGSGKGAFGTTSNPLTPDLGGPSSNSAIPTHSAIEQASSAAKSGKDAVMARTPEGAKRLSNCQFDTTGCRTPDTISIPRPAQTPGTVELAKHIPGPAQKDEVIRQSMAYFQKLDGEKIRTQTKLKTVQRQLDRHEGDATALKGQEETLRNDLKRYTEDQEKTQTQIKERIVKIGLQWNESPSPAISAKEKP